MTNKPKRKTQSTSATRDLIAIAVLAILAYGLSVHFNAFEAFIYWLQHSKNADDWQIDELFVVSVILSVGFGAFSFRRWRDVKEGIRAQDELAASRDSALESTRLKSEFLANMSHELRTPMNGIIGFTELTLDTVLDSEQREYLTTANACANSLLTIIDEILDVSSLQAGNLGLKATNFSLHDCLADAIKSLATVAHKKNLELVIDISPDVPDALIGDGARLGQIILNLAGNAIKFTQTGKVIVRAQCRWQTENHLCLHMSVADTGIGIAKSQQKAIFNSFTQADGSSTRMYGGTGLGLTISTQLVELMGGEIWVESELERGSTFHFKVNLDLQASEISPVPLPAISDVQHMRWLAAD